MNYSPRRGVGSRYISTLWYFSRFDLIPLFWVVDEFSAYLTAERWLPGTFRCAGSRNPSVESEQMVVWRARRNPEAARARLLRARSDGTKHLTPSPGATEASHRVGGWKRGRVHRWYRRLANCGAGHLPLLHPSDPSSQGRRRRFHGWYTPRHSGQGKLPAPRQVNR